MTDFIIDKQTGTFHLTEDFSFAGGTFEADLCRHFKLEATTCNRNLSYITVQNVIIGNFHFNFTFTFQNSALDNFLFKVSDGPFPKNYQAPQSDWGYSAAEIKLFEFNKQWLKQQVGVEDNFSWGTVKAIWQPLSGGAIIYLQYDY